MRRHASDIRPEPPGIDLGATPPVQQKRSWFRRFRRPSERRSDAGLGTFHGVYRPTILTILGVMMYVREGWLVGQAGLGGALLIILIIFVITGSAALSVSSITSNIRIGGGGVFSIVSQSLGLEAGGSIGVPLFLGQALSGALYIYGFSEAWLYIFPHHPQMLVAYCVFCVLLGATLVSTRMAFKLQGLVLLVILASLASIVLGLTNVGGAPEFHEPRFWGTFQDSGFWLLFAIFFPAGTGVMVGASMSATLENPRKSIPRGTLAAVSTAVVVYVLMAVWYSVLATPEELRENYLIVVERAAIGELVLAGILASTFTAALSSMVAAPQVLQALGEYGVVPRHGILKRSGPSREPRVAILATGLLVALALLLGSLDRVAVLITMFFLLTYLTINLIVLIEQKLGMISFRPTFRIPSAVPLGGTAACLIAIFVISPAFALIAIAMIVGIYAYLVRKKLETPWETVRSSVFVSLADWAAKNIAHSSDEAHERSWKPDLLVPVESRSQIDGVFRLLYQLAAPKGSVKIIGIRSESDTTEATEPHAPSMPVVGRGESGRRGPVTKADVDAIHHVARVFQAEGMYATAVVIEAPSLAKGVDISASVMRGSFFKPNIIFGLAHQYDEETLQQLVDIAAEYEMGVALFYRHPEAALGYERTINIWVRDQSPDWQIGLRLANLDLSVLLAYQLNRYWHGDMRLLTIAREEANVGVALEYVRELIEDARLPARTQVWVQHGAFAEQLSAAPRADINVFGLARKVDLQFLRTLVNRTNSSALFVRDSGRESALA